MHSDAGIWQLAVDLIARHGSGAKKEAIKLANLISDHGDQTRQGVWLRVWTAIEVLQSEASEQRQSIQGISRPVMSAASPVAHGSPRP
jgi:hypothetical protein